MLDVGVSAAAHELREEQSRLDMEQVSLGSAYVEFRKSIVWKDLQEAMDQQVRDAESAIIEAEAGESLDKKRDNFITYQVWKKMRVALEQRVNSMTETYQDYIKETTQHGNDHA
jgi:macrodomain Ter protein organizer (MatP/YcbG family)